MVYFFSQQMGTPECDDPTLRQHHVITRGRISTSSLLFLFDAKFAESADQHIFTLFQGIFYLFKQDLDQLGGSVFGKPEFIVNGINNLCFCQCH
jgi:hypothetical protein